MSRELLGQRGDIMSGRGCIEEGSQGTPRRTKKNMGANRKKAV
jgi:hypothetical protein